MNGLSSCSNFPERPSSYELESDKPVLPEIEHLKGKIGEGDLEKLRDLLNWNADVFSKHKADIGCCNFVEHEIELEEGAVPHREGARRMTPPKSEACRAEIDAVHIGYEADVTAHLLDTNGTKIGVTGLLDTGAVVSVMPIKTWERMGFTREDLIPTNLRLAAANRGAIYVAGRTPLTVLHMGGRDIWMSFLVVENLDDADQFILGRDFVRNFDVMIDLNNGLIQIRNPDRKYVKRPINRIITDKNKVPIFLDRKVKLQPGQAVVAIFRMRNLNSLSDSEQVCLVPNPNSQSSVILGRSFS